MASSLRSSGGVTFFLETPCCDEDPPAHISNACSLCRSPLRASSEVYMYRGDTPFCSEECRQEQIKLDGAREREMRYRRRRLHRHRTASPVEQPSSTAAASAQVVAS